MNDCFVAYMVGQVICMLKVIFMVCLVLGIKLRGDNKK